MSTPAQTRDVRVTLEHGGKTYAVGVIRLIPERAIGFFTYLPDYSGPPLDPINLDYRRPFDGKDRRRYSERTFVIDANVCPGLLHQVFVDSMPGHWGMAVLQAEYPEIKQMRDGERLYWMQSRTVGALSFFVDARTDEQPVRGLDELEVVRAKCAEFLATMERMGLMGIRNPAVASHGGVMPKASYEDANGRHWIAKFDKIGDGAQTCLLEHTASVMAQRCGVSVPNTRILKDGQGGHMFLSERYDRLNGERHHRISMFSMIGVKDASGGDYRDIFKVLKQVCDPVAYPAQRDEMLRRLAVVIGLNVTDDHLRNHEMMLTPQGTWVLTPAFDLVPVSGAAPHQCAIFGQARADINLKNPATHALWARIAHELEVTPAHVFDLVSKVASSIEANWPALVQAHGMNQFNQMNALMAAEVGCKVPFPDRAQNPKTVPLTHEASQELAAASLTIQRAMQVLGGRKVNAVDSLRLSRELMTLHGESAKMVHTLRAAGQTQAADLLLTAPLKAAARAVLETSHGDAGMWRDLSDAGMSIEAAARGLGPGKAQPPRVAPR